MTIVSMKINDFYHFFILPKTTVDKMLLDYDLTEAYFQQAVKLSYFTRYPEGAKASQLHIRKRIPQEVPIEYIFKFGYCKNRKILQSVRKTFQAKRPVDLIQKCIGVFGRWHLSIYLLILLCRFPIAFHQLCIVFIGPNINFECTDTAIDRCSKDCPGHAYDKSTFENTITMQWDLVCERGHWVKLAQTLTTLGILAGNLLFGYLSDVFGRKRMLVCEIAVQAAAGVVTAFVPWWWLYLFMTFLTAAATGGVMVTGFVLVMEIVGRRGRTIAGILYQIPASLAHVLLASISYALRDWRMVQVAMSAPSILMACCCWLLPESPRWLLLMGKRDLAVKVLRRAAERNKLPTDHIEGAVDEHSLHARPGRIQELFRTAIMRKYALAICFNWMVVGLCLLELSQHVSHHFGSDVFLSVGFSGLAQTPGILFSWWCLETWGRKWSLVAANSMVAATCLTLSVVTSSERYDRFLSAVGLFGAMLALCVVYVYSVEMFPTTSRCFGVGLSMAFARIGVVVGPAVGGLDVVRFFLPPLIFGVFALVGVGMCFLLPETLDSELPTTVEDVECLKKASRGR